MPALPPLIAVVGPVEPALLTAWVSHYRGLGIERFHLAFHFTEHVDPDRRHQVQDGCRELGIVPDVVSVGAWHEHTNPRLRDALRECAGAGWHLLADSDELHAYPAPLAEVITAAEVSGTGTVGGLMLDRVTADGFLTGWSPEQGLDAAYPLGGFLTHRLLRGDPRKIVLAHSDVPVASGNHRSEGHRPANRPPVVVHHFKWRDGVREDVERRAEHSADGTWKTASPARLAEARRLLEHLQRHDGRIAVDSPRLDFRPVSLTAVPDWWEAQATPLVATWQPPTPAPGQTEVGSMTSSPSS
ncbi:hypothetical protein [Streptomyces sp. NPDC046909]|uniref:hypothetical protein n=1 Tax=Streptomyces sp. NPDC046909 TaxID=3155617 RepID=UPI003408BA4B